MPTPEEVMNAAIEKARKEEKEKLYADLKAKDDKIKAAEDKLKALEAGGSPDVLAMKTQLEQMQLAAQLRDSETAKLQAEAAERERKAKLETYKLTKIAAVGVVNLIPDLVVGNTEAEIDAAVVSSQAKFKEIRDKIAEEQRLAAPGGGMPPISGGGGSANGGAGGGGNGFSNTDGERMPDVITAEWVKSLTPAQFDKHKAELHRQIKEQANKDFRTIGSIK